MKRKRRYALVISVLIIMTGCVAENGSQSGGVRNETAFNEALGITAVPASMGRIYRSNFDRSTKVLAPNGKPIRIVAQNDISQEQILRCRGILEHYLRDYPGSKYGTDKKEVANKMADNGAVLALMNGQDDGENDVRVNAQPLFKNEIQVEGHAWYVNQDYGHRDAAFEEILHFVHDNGIGVDGPNSRPGAAPEFQKEIRASQVKALALKIWADNARAHDWIKELDEENSLSQEYLASVIDSYYGLWGAWGEGERGMWGLYIAKVRDEIKIRDPGGYDLMNNKFFHPYLTYNARIDENFTGTFSLKFDDAIPYSHHSRYLKDITLLGSNDSNVRVNELDNDITGNNGVNKVVFSGKVSEYKIETNNGVTTVSDDTPHRDGENVLKNIERLEFRDQIIEL